MTQERCFVIATPGDAKGKQSTAAGGAPLDCRGVSRLAMTQPVMGQIVRSPV